MLKRQGIGVVVAMVAVALVGAGCLKTPVSPSPSVSTQATSTISSPRPLSLAGLDPRSAAHAINFIGGNTFQLKQAFTGRGAVLAQSIGLGRFVDRSIVIRRFAPSNLAEIEWKATTKVPTPVPKDAAHVSQLQYVGAVAGGNLRDGHALYPPVYWKEGDGVALGSGILWLSQDVYEDLAKIHTSTMKFGLEDGGMLGFASSSPELRQQIRDLQAEINKVIDRKDVFATNATTSTVDLMVNGTSTEVEVLVAKNWFGEITILNNPEDPLVLSMKIATPGGIDFGGLFDYQITEIKDLQQ